jgi:hypothetical protein
VYGGWEPPWRLLHLDRVPALQSRARTALDRTTKELQSDAAARQQPDWLGQLARITATGEVWEIRDAYGARIAVIAGFSYPEGVDRSVFLFDIDACGVIEIVHAGVFDDVQQAATAWRALVGDTADSATTLRFCVVDCGACLDGGKYRLRAIHRGKSRHREGKVAWPRSI